MQDTRGREGGRCPGRCGPGGPAPRTPQGGGGLLPRHRLEVFAHRLFLKINNPAQSCFHQKTTFTCGGRVALRTLSTGVGAPSKAGTGAGRGQAAVGNHGYVDTEPQLGVFNGPLVGSATPICARPGRVNTKHICTCGFLPGIACSSKSFSGLNI